MHLSRNHPTWGCKFQHPTVGFRAFIEACDTKRMNPPPPYPTLDSRSARPPPPGWLSIIQHVQLGLIATLASIGRVRPGHPVTDLIGHFILRWREIPRWRGIYVSRRPASSTNNIHSPVYSFLVAAKFFSCSPTDGRK